MRLRLNRRTTSFTAAVTVPALVAVLAVLGNGFPVARLDLDDGGVWLTSKSALALGRYNVPVQELDGGLAAASSVFDVAQDGAQVLLIEPGQISVVDPATVSAVTRVSIGADSTAGLAGGTVLVASSDGKVWVRGLADLGTLDVVGGQPDVDLGAGAKAVVAPDGAVLTVAGDGSAAIRRPNGAGSSEQPDGSIDGTVGSVDQLTAVGDEPVVLDGRTVRTRHGSVQLDGDQLTLQQPGPAADRVLVAGTNALYEVPLDGGRPTVHPTTGAGKPAAPVQVGSCAYAAWAATTGNWMRLCGATTTTVDREGVAADTQLVFRVNRSKVVLNDVATGRAWLPQDPKVRVPDWEQVQPKDANTTPDKSDGSQVTQAQSTECSEQGAPPTAVDDQFGVRPGRTTVLPVLDNDTTADCGILVIKAVDPIPAGFGSVELVEGGRALQVAVAPTATGSVSFTYTVNDRPGARAPATGTVTLTVHDDSVNGEPVQVRTSTMRVELGGSLQRNVLGDFTDPDGDQLALLGATLDPTFGSVSSRPDGTLTVQASGQTGSTVMSVQVSDGRGGTPVTGQVNVVVADPGSVGPQIDPVHEVGYVNQALVVEPLSAVRSTGAEPARLAGVGDVPGATIVPDLTGGSFTFTAARAGTYYVSFTVVASPAQATGWARIDVHEYPEQVQAPVAMVDEALLPNGGTVTIDPLANDEDPNGLVLVLQSVDPPVGLGLHAAVIDHHLVEITADRTLDRPTAVPYVVSNGTATAAGSILVQSIPAPAIAQPPVVPDVEATVRTGAVVTIAALAHAYDPDGGTLTLDRELPEPLAADQGLLFVSGDVLRYQAPATPMTVTATFQVTSAAGVSTAARVTVRVHASDETTKVAPRPQPVVARVFEAETVRIPIPLVGIDPDGDGVTLLGLGDTPPSLGIITAVGPDYLEYRALPGETGTDTFSYAVEDWTGQRAVGQVRVGVSARPDGADTVVARDDAVTVAPGRTVEIRVLANDVDSGGGDLTLDPTLALSGDVGAGTGAAVAKVSGGQVQVTAPATAGVLQVQYTARSTRGGQGTAVLTVTVDAAAPVLPPIAQDVVVPATETIGRTEVEVDVLAVAQNPSGPLSELDVVVPATASATAKVGENRKIVVTLVDHPQTLPYQLVNVRDRTAASYAFITVPALGFFPPTPRPKAPALRVASGQELVIPLDTQVQVAPGRVASIADATKVTATRSDGSGLVVDAHTVRFASAAGYAGPASVTVPVTDSTGAGDSDARQATITLSISVYAVDDHPPTFTPSTIEVGPGDPPLTVDLTAYMRNPEGDVPKSGDYGFTQTGAVPAGFTVTLTGSQLRVSAAATAAKGTSGTLSLSISYGRSGSLPVTVPLEVIASTRALARVLDQTVDDGQAGRDRVVQVLAGAFDPFAAEGGSLTVVGATVETAGAGTATTNGSQVSVRPDAGFVGVMVTRFRVRDMTRDPDREVEGRILLRVSTLPDAPTAPSVQEIRDQAVVLSWVAPGNGGDPIQGYRVTAEPGGPVTDCSSTTCTVTGLTNGTDYTFTVAARNAVGWSSASPSVTARPDAVPDAPAAARLTAGDGSVTATWDPPANHGSAIVSYQVEISPAPNDPKVGAVQQPTSTSATFTGLVNGQSYTVRVRAYNKSPQPGGWSPWSAAAVPATVPDAPGGLTAARVATPAGGQIALTWTAPSGNGARLGEYRLAIDGPGQTVTTSVDAGATSYTLRDAVNGVPYTFTLVATNQVGASAPATASASTFGVPAAPTGVRVVGSRTASPPGEATADVTWKAADGNGSAVTSYQLTFGGRTVEVGAVTAATIGGLTGGQPVTVQVSGCNAAGCGPAAAGTSIPTPLTVPSVVTGAGMSVAAFSDRGLPTSVEVHWSPPADWGQAVVGDYVVTLAADGKQIGSATLTDRSVVFAVPAKVSQGAQQVVFTAGVAARSAVGAGTTVSPSITWTATAPGAVGALNMGLQPFSSTQSALWATWQAAAGDVDHYEAEYSFDDQNWTAPADLAVTPTNWWTPVGVLLAPGDRVYLRVRAVSTSGLPGPWAQASRTY